MASTFRRIIPQPARGKFADALLDSPDWIAEEKFDGERRIAQMTGGVVRFTGRPSRVSGSPVEKTEQLPHLSGLPVDGRSLLYPRSLDGTVIDGELVLSEGYGEVEGGKSKAVTSIANSRPSEAIRKQRERGWLRYVVFDCLYWKGESILHLPLSERRKYARCAVDTWGNPFVSIAKQVQQGKREFLREIYDRDGEGIILKAHDHKYGDEKGWVKVKRVQTADVIIMGFIPAKEQSRKVDGTVSATKYAKQGLVGAVACGQYVGKMMSEVATVSGMDDGLRRRFSMEPKAYIGMVIEIAFNDREPTGRFRHPRFKRFRDDKDPRNCLFDLDEA